MENYLIIYICFSKNVKSRKEMLENKAIFKVKRGPENGALCHVSKGDNGKVVSQWTVSISEFN